MQVLHYEKVGLENREHSVRVVNPTSTMYTYLDAIDISSTGQIKAYNVWAWRTKTAVIDMVPGDRIICEYVASANSVGTFSNLGASTKELIPAGSSATPNGSFYFYMVGYDSSGRRKLIADRNIQTSISWLTLNNAGIACASGKNTEIDGSSKYTVRLLYGGNYANDTDGEVRRIMGMYSLDGVIAAGDNAIWNWSGIYSWAYNVPNSSDVNVVVYGSTAASTWGYYAASSVVATGGFRPVLLEGTSADITVSSVTTTHLYYRQHTECTINAEAKLEGTPVEFVVKLNGVYFDTYSFDNVRVIPLNRFSQGANNIRVQTQDGSYASINIVNEVPRRVSVGRTFKSYDRGYTLDNVTLNGAASTESSGTIKTTPLTSIDLHSYSGITKVATSGFGGKYIVSFDGGSTWKSKPSDIDENTVSYLNFDNDFSDVAGKIWTPYGSASVSSANSKFGGKSLALNGTNSYLTTPATNDFSFGNGDFTVDWWDYRISNNQGCAFATNSVTTAYAGLIAGYGGTGVYCYASSSLGSWDVLSAFSMGSVILNAWTHYALVRKGNTFYSFQNGVLIGTATSGLALASCTIGAIIGAWNQYFNGYIDSLRVSKGLARWTASFTPPTSALSVVGPWETVNPSEARVKGMFPVTLANISPAQWSDVFQRTQLDLYGALSNSDYLEGVNVTLPPNSGPIIGSTVLSPGTLHSGVANLTAVLTEPEEDTISYRLTVGDEEIVPWTNLKLGPINVNHDIPWYKTKIGSNIVKLEAMDNVGAISTPYTGELIRTDVAPNIIASRSNRILSFSLSDVEGDYVNYRITVNGNVRVDWSSEYKPSPHNVVYKVDRHDVNIGVNNTVTIECMDSYGAVATQDIVFMGEYSGLLFSDISGNLYSDDQGNVLIPLVLGPIVSGQTSEVYEVTLTNKTGLALLGTSIKAKAGTVPAGVTFKLSTNDGDNFEGIDEVNVPGIMQPSDSITFYVRAVAGADTVVSSTIQLEATARLA
jgi:hypothetical protein